MLEEPGPPGRFALVREAGRWYVVALTDGELRTYRIGQLLALDPLDDTFDPPADCDLTRHRQAHSASPWARRWRYSPL
ncbi:WYL domain-containing protein [Streptomyces sp. NBC_01171]|uniref:WYL domain-containing protein n=1 Tax=Streptomyces sp. NBC_01171 TaxID=2903757 RepID=UPI0038686BC9|nr:WYL domain-containing protein [Streptomyces sp. NBC_01171]